MRAKIDSFNEKQARYFNAYSDALKGQSEEKLFRLLGEEVSGKTSVITTVIEGTTLAGKKILASAYSGIAVTLIINANTVQSTCGISINPADPKTAMRNIRYDIVSACIIMERLENTPVGQKRPSTTGCQVF